MDSVAGICKEVCDLPRRALGQPNVSWSDEPRASVDGRSLKFCRVAEGKADIYLRDVPTMDWDTTVAQCIVEAAGGGV